MEKYNGYTVADFLEDDAFTAYVKHKRDAVSWEQWLESDPPARPAFEEAVLTIETILAVQPVTVPAGAMEDTWGRVEKGMVQQGRVRQLRRTVRVAIAAAACIAAILVGGWYYYTAKITVRTGYAETREVLLPDHSVVTLNAHSSLSYYRAWSWHSEREVWLTGEGLFNVEHTKGGNEADQPAGQFTAYVDQLSVEVLGTTFNIKDRRDSVTIALLEGRIRVTDRGPQAKTLVMQKGDVVEYKDSLTRRTTVQQLSNEPKAWTDRKIMASGMTVQDIMDAYEDMYGYRIILDRPQQAQKKIDGTLSLENGDDVLYMLANILNADVERKDSLIYLRSK